MKISSNVSAFICFASMITGCGGSRPNNPVAPARPEADAIVTGTRPPSSVVVSATPVPLVALPTGTPGRFRVSAELTFKELLGIERRVTRLQITVTPGKGSSTVASDDVDVRIPALGSATHAVATIVDTTETSQLAIWRLTASGTDADGDSFEVPAVQQEVRFEGFASAPDATFVGAGDIAYCVGKEGETARLLDSIPGTVFTLGDNVYPRGTAEQFTKCYTPTWGRHLSRTLATIGNHDFDEAGGGPYYSYFGASAGPAMRGYYSTEVGSWHVISLNSNVPAGAGSPQYEWLKADLAASAASCTLAMWHHPLFSSGPSGGAVYMRDAWRLLQQHGADIVLNGHDHDYERFAPQDVTGHADPRGMRQFIVGTGGASLYGRATYQPTSEIFENRAWGVLKLTLKSGSYDWQFVPIDGYSFTDLGSGTCVTSSGS